MSLPAPRNASTAGGLVPYEPQVDDAEFRVRDVIPAVRRSKWLILACAAISFSAAAIYARKAEPVYQAAVSVWIEDVKQKDVPDVFRAFSQDPDVATDIAALGSRTLVEEATRILNLQVRLTRPRGVQRDALVQNIHVTPDAKAMEYRLERQDDSTFVVSDEDDGRFLPVRVGQQLSLPGVTLQLDSEAVQFPELRLQVEPFADAVAQTGPLSVARAGKDANIITLQYEDTDQGLAWKVPNVIAEQFIARRQEAQKATSRGQAKFLREQIDTIAAQLATAESQLKTFRERVHVVNPEVESNSQINRLINLQAERGSLEAERSALASLLAEVEARHKQQAPGKPSVYRELLGFPSLLRNQAASQLLSSLAQVEDQRATLLTRRTDADPDVQLLSGRIVELENQLSTMAGAYLKGLSNQVSSLDAAIGQFGGELGKMPRKEMEFARLERKPEVLKEMYSLLQTRLKEAEIAEAAVNSSISIQDPAIEPRYPVNSKAWLLMLAGLVGGTLLGIGLSVAREYADGSIKTRSDATSASGLPVMAIVPRITRNSRRSAIIARRSTSTKPKEETPPYRPQSPSTNGGYTFLSGTPPEENAASAPKANVGPGSTVSTHSPARMSLSRSAGSVAEAYAILQTNIAFSRPEERIKVLALTSALPGEGKTTTAVNLALTMCQRGLSVCLVDADLRRPQLHEIFHVAREPGLSEVLRGMQTFGGACRPVEIGEGHHLAVLTAGGQGGNAPALVGSARMRGLLSDLREQFDLVILDTPPVNILTDAALLGVNADGVLVVVRAGSTDTTALQYAMEQLNHVRAPALGIVLNDVDLKRFGAYDGAYKYYSYAAYTDAGTKPG